MLGLRLPELIIILVILLLLFGAKKLPGLAKSLGSSAKEFKTALARKLQSHLKVMEVTLGGQLR